MKKLLILLILPCFCVAQTPSVKWILPDTITYGQLLILKARANVKGRFEMTPTKGRYPYFNDYNIINAGDYVISLKFIPANKKYKPVFKTKNLHVKKANYYSSGTTVPTNPGTYTFNIGDHYEKYNKPQEVYSWQFVLKIMLILTLASMIVIDKIYQVKSIDYLYKQT